MRRLMSMLTPASHNPERRLPSWRMLAVMSFSCAVLASSALAYHKWDQLITQFHERSVRAGFGLEYLDISGRSNTSEADIFSSLGLEKNTPIMSIDLNEARERLLAIGWVEDVFVSRQLPNRLQIMIFERTPLALMQTTSGHKVIDRQGVEITEADPALFSHLPVVSGTDAHLSASTVLDMLQTEPELFADVWAVQLISKRRWDVHLRSGITVRLPEEDPGLAWSRLARIESESKIMARDIAAIDLRIPDKLVVEPNLLLTGKGQKT